MAGNQQSRNGGVGEGKAVREITEDRWKLAGLITDRIEERHFLRKEIAAKANVSPATLREMEHPRGPRNFGRIVLESVSGALGWSNDYLMKEVYPASPQGDDPVVKSMMKALSPYLEKINSVPRLQKDIEDIKVRLGMKADVTADIDDHSTAP